MYLTYMNMVESYKLFLDRVQVKATGRTLTREEFREALNLPISDQSSPGEAIRKLLAQTERMQTIPGSTPHSPVDHPLMERRSFPGKNQRTLAYALNAQTECVRTALLMTLEDATAYTNAVIAQHGYYNEHVIFEEPEQFCVGFNADNGKIIDVYFFEDTQPEYSRLEKEARLLDKKPMEDLVSFLARYYPCVPS